MGQLTSRRRTISLLCAASLLVAALAVGAWQYFRYRRACWHWEAAHVEVDRYRYDAAREHALQAADYWPNRGTVRFLAARLCRRAADPAGARNHLDAARALLGDTEGIRLEQQLLTAQRGEASEFAENALWERTRTDADNRLLIYEALTVGRLSTFRIERAKQVLDAWLQSPADDPRPWYWRGLAQAQIGGYLEDQAIGDFRAAIARDPDFDEARERLGHLLLKTHHNAEAREQFEELRRRQPNDAKVMIGLAQTLGEPEPARELLAAALRIEPDNVDGLRELGMLTLNEARPEEAEPLLRRAYELLPQDPYASYNYMLCLQKLGREKEAKEQQARHEVLAAKSARLFKLMREEIPRQPRDPELLHEVGKLYLETGNPEYETSGLWWMQKTLEVAPNHAATLKVLADYFERKNRPELAARLRLRLRAQ